MSLSSAYTNAIGRIPELFKKIRDGQAPDVFSQQLLKDWGFKSSNDRAALPLLKELGFLSPDGKPTSLYHEYRDHSRSKAVMAQALRSAYQDIFLIKEHPTDEDKDIIKGKFKSYHNVSDNVANLMAKTFFAILDLADLKADSDIKNKHKTASDELPEKDVAADKPNKQENLKKPYSGSSGLHYNIQIHLPATKDVEVFNAIFKSLKEHLFEI